MPKKKRTRKDKIHTDVRRQSTSSADFPKKSVSTTRENDEQSKQAEPSIGTFSLPQEYTQNAPKKTAVRANQTIKTVAVDTSSYSYLRGDLLKTTFLTLTIVGAELFVYFFIMK
jgi:hypothetical protein